MTEWKPIETAPRDGRDFLGFCDPFVEMVSFNRLRKGFCVVNAPIEFAKVEPTHWMPLPEPPKTN